MANIAVAGAGYWGKNLVRNFYEPGALKAICDKQKGLRGSIPGKIPWCHLHRGLPIPFA